MPCQGALDGGLDIPHNEKRFVGYDASSKEYDAELMKKYIFGGHVGDYMEEMAEEEPEKYQAHFATYLEQDLDTVEALEEMYTEVTRSRGDISVTVKNPASAGPVLVQCRASHRITIHFSRQHSAGQ